MATVDLTDPVVAVVALIAAAVITVALVRALLRILPPRRPPGPGTDEEPEG